jgi:putative FmdB family regulatory protein
MPIYAYRCSACGHQKDVLQKLSDAPLSTCPACGAETFTKQVTAAGFQLKGSGWYATDFRNNGAPKPTPDKPSPDAADSGSKGQDHGDSKKSSEGKESVAAAGVVAHGATSSGKEAGSSTPSTSPAAGPGTGAGH